MSHEGVDYDRIAPGYNRRFVAGGTPGVAAALAGLAAGLAGLASGPGPRSILEAGCGTGHWLAGLAGTGASLWGLDRSAGMLREAGRRPQPLSLVQGRAERLPYAGGSFDLVYCVNALHHFDDQPAFVLEARRLLRAGGALAVVGMEPRPERHHWYVYDYFEGAYETDVARFPSWGTLADWLIAAGFRRLAWQPVHEIRATKRGRAVLDDPFLQRDATSQLTLLSDQAYAAGLQRIQAGLAAAEAAGETLLFPNDLTLGMMAGWLDEAPAGRAA